jgi:hypothetical protein
MQSDRFRTSTRRITNVQTALAMIPAENPA